MNINDGFRGFLSFVSTLAFIATIAVIGSGCSTTHTLRNTPAGSVVTHDTSAAGIYRNTEVTQESAGQYNACLQARGVQPNVFWTDNQRECFGQTTIGQVAAGMFGFGSPMFNNYGMFFQQNMIPGLTMPMPTGHPNIVMMNGRPILIPGGANTNEGWAGPLAAAQTAAMESLRLRASLPNQANWQVASPQQPAPVAAQPTAQAPAFGVTREQWDALMRQVTTLSTPRTR